MTNQTTQAPHETDDAAWDFYYAQLDAVGDLLPKEKWPEPHPGKPEKMLGFYRRIGKDRETRAAVWVPVAIYTAPDGSAVCRDGNREIRDRDVVDEVLGQCCRNPIPYELYVAVTEQGAAWPDQPPEAAKAEQDFTRDIVSEEDQLRDEATRELERFKQEIANGVTDENADKVGNWMQRAAQRLKTLDAQRAAEKKPHDDAAKAIQAKWKPILEIWEQFSKLGKPLVTRHLTEKQRRIDEQRAKETLGLAQPDLGAQDRPQTASIGGGTGRKMSLATRKVAVIKDPRAFADYLLSLNQGPHPDVLETLQKVANRIVSAGASAPGIEIETTATARV